MKIDTTAKPASDEPREDIERELEDTNDANN